MNKEMSIIILAAGKGTRMESNCPKLLHKLGNKTILQYVIETAQKINKRKIFLICNQKILPISSCIKDHSIEWILQNKPLGTGDAVKQAEKKILDNEDILVLSGDVPLISKKTIERLRQYKKQHKIILLTMKINKPYGYGRILRKNGKIIKIIEDNELNINEKKIKEIYSGIFIVNGIDLKKWIQKINNNNLKKEYYITDIISFAVQEGCFIPTVQPYKDQEILGINNQSQLSFLEKNYKIIT
ncbi:sugar phosphate nucleotidyltransferase [Buchnera aphidicola]|uniref:sugar phosphate nucleotidyltransferase n=1 Tax=Buchnera aphidicola TaxID=9 RepID=UPI003BEF07E0